MSSRTLLSDHVYGRHTLPKLSSTFIFRAAQLDIQMCTAVSVKESEKRECQNHRKNINFPRSIFHIHYSGWLLFTNRTVVIVTIKLKGHEIRLLIRWPQIDVLCQLAITRTVMCSSSGVTSPRPCCPSLSSNYWLAGNATHPRTCETMILWHVCDLHIRATIKRTRSIHAAQIY